MPPPPQMLWLGCKLRVEWFPEGACGPGAAHGADLGVVGRPEAPEDQKLRREHDRHRNVPRHGAGGEREGGGALVGGKGQSGGLGAGSFGAKKGPGPGIQGPHIGERRKYLDY